MLKRRKFIKNSSLVASGSAYIPFFLLSSMQKGNEDGRIIKFLKNKSNNEKLLVNYVKEFNRLDDELYPQTITNESALDFLKNNIPLFECPDKEIEKTYYFRWWTFRKHLKKTDDGWVITEFLPQIGHAGKHNTVS